MFCISLVFFALDQIPKIKICHMVASEHPEVIEGRLRSISIEVIDSEDSSGGCSIGDDGDS